MRFSTNFGRPLPGHRRQRKGAAAVFLCVLMVPLLFLLAFSIDYGFLLYVETNLQRTSDQAAIAAVRELAPDPYGNQDLAAVRQAVRDYVNLNLGDGFTVDDEDIEIGRYNPNTIYGDIELLNDGILDTVRVTLRRDDTENTSVSLYFARLFGNDDSGVAARSTAVLQKASYLGPGADVFPFSIQRQAWNHLNYGDSAVIYGSGQILDENGQSIPGNWGTLDIGSQSNSTDALSDQILTGLTQDDLDALYSQGSIPTNEYIDANLTIDLNGDTGLSAGLRHALEDVEGLTRIAPIYKKTTSQGGNLYFEVVSWASITVGTSTFRGSNNSSVQIQKSYAYDENLYPNPDLSNTSNVIEGAYTSPVLVE